MMERIEDQALRAVLEERVSHLRKMTSWYRDTLPWLRSILLDYEKRDRAELAALLRLQRKAQRIAAKAPDPIEAAKAWHDWQSSAEAYSVR